MQKLPFILVTLLAALSLYFGLMAASAVNSRNSGQGAIAELNYDGYSEGINTRLYDEAGIISYTLQAERQVYFKDSSSALFKPRLQLHRNGEIHWLIVADDGKITPHKQVPTLDTGTIELFGAVEVLGLDPNGHRTVLTTEYLAIDTQAQKMETDCQVRMITTSIEQTAQGLFADFNSDQLFFRQDSRGRYEATEHL
ncbi:MAG: LPS export ABC transporter periplasmic protein LptC [Gammaproteobacteria bacterium]|nr:LPS export ABC transporter periplasmic protein LptC [Gammaproteobacteria bacterium]